MTHETGARKRRANRPYVTNIELLAMSRMLRLHLVDGDASSDTLCPKCQQFSVYGADASPVKEER